ncbi:hypothetical protein [Actinomycetospora sp. CA-053990]|uniref:hypothetical protein n=1 Tax=Actinomycetospora sp. CA-053990 TaxID=3239891 RepID=UPI003D938FD3
MPRDSLAAASRDGHLALRRVERQQAVIERLHTARGARLQLADLARDLGVAPAPWPATSSACATAASRSSRTPGAVAA